MQQMANPYDTAARQAAAPDALWDVAYYQGRYYVYFGVVPCLLFQLPFEALTGVPDLPPSLPMIALGWLLILASFGCVKQALRRWFPRASAAPTCWRAPASPRAARCFTCCCAPRRMSMPSSAAWRWPWRGCGSGWRRPTRRYSAARRCWRTWRWAVCAWRWWPAAARRWNCSPYWRCPSSGSVTWPKNACAAAPGQGKRWPLHYRLCWWRPG